jgi:phospholipase C
VAIFESAYNRVLRRLFRILNPFKKTIIQTHCEVHKYINKHSISLLEKFDYKDEHEFFSFYLQDMNEGTVWVDQDFNSSNHFYNPYKDRGLYGRRSAMDLAIEYYDNALELWNKGDKNKSLFYFGAAIHIIQDLTIPQHSNIRLLDDHRQYENFIKKTYQYVSVFKAKNKPYMLDNIEDYVRFNSRVAIKIYKKFSNIKKDENRYYRVAKCTIPLSMRTSAGAMIMFYNEILPIDKNI